jgi:hypothetical protein
VQRFLNWWLRVPASMWLLRVSLLSLGIEAMEGIHGWPRLIPVALFAAAALTGLAEGHRRRRDARAQLIE